MSIRLLLGVLLLSVMVLGVALVDAESGAEPYHYMAYDTSGTAVVRGTLFVDIHEQNEKGQRTITGTWSTNQIVDTVQVGPQVGEGALEGTIGPDGTLSIDMNPDAEGNIWTTIILESKQTDDLHRFRGQWIKMERKGMGPTIRKVKGTFEATRTEEGKEGHEEK